MNSITLNIDLSSRTALTRSIAALTAIVATLPRDAQVVNNHGFDPEARAVDTFEALKGAADAPKPKAVAPVATPSHPAVAPSPNVETAAGWTPVTPTPVPTAPALEATTMAAAQPVAAPAVPTDNVGNAPIAPAVTDMAPAPTTPVPPVVPTPTTVAATGVELDSEGIPWDGRIHQDAKGRMQKGAGAWKVKRGIDKELVEQVKNELRTAMAGAPQPVAPAASADPTPGTVGEISSPLVPAEGHTFATLLAACTAKGITPEQVAQAASDCSGGTVTAVPLLGPRADLIPFVAAALGV